MDDYTVKVRWQKPYFLSEEATLMLPIIPRHVYSVDSRGDLISLDFSSEEFAEGFNNHWANTPMCGTGPLIFDSWHRTERVVLVRNPEYWGPPFYFSRVVFHCETNENTLVQKLLQRKLDWADISQADLYDAGPRRSAGASGQGQTRRVRLSQLSLHGLQPAAAVSERSARFAGR